MANPSVLAESISNDAALQYRATPEELAATETNRQTLIDAVVAFGKGDADAFWAIFHQDAVFHEAACLPYGGAHAGLEAIQRAFAHLHSTFTTLDAKMETALAARDLVILYQSVTFHTPARGNAGTIPVAEVFRFRDRKVIEWRAHYFDSNFVAEALKPA